LLRAGGKEINLYQKNLKEFADDTKFKDQMMEFTITSEDSKLDEEHRPLVLPVVIRLL